MSATEVTEEVTPMGDDPDDFWSVWTRPEVIGAIFDAASVCETSDDPDWSADDWHLDPDRFDLDDLIDMFQASDELCILHVKASYPAACVGEIGRQYGHAFERLVKHTRAHTGIDPWRHSTDGTHHYYVTPAELRQLWDDFPHSRHLFEQYATEDDPRLVIHRVMS